MEFREDWQRKLESLREEQQASKDAAMASNLKWRNARDDRQGMAQRQARQREVEREMSSVAASVEETQLQIQVRGEARGMTAIPCFAYLFDCSFPCQRIARPQPFTVRLEAGTWGGGGGGGALVWDQERKHLLCSSLSSPFPVMLFWGDQD